MRNIEFNEGTSSQMNESQNTLFSSMERDISDDESTISEDLCGIPNNETQHTVIMQTQRDGTPTEQQVALMVIMSSVKNLSALKGAWFEIQIMKILIFFKFKLHQVLHTFPFLLNQMDIHVL